MFSSATLLKLLLETTALSDGEEMKGKFVSLSEWVLKLLQYC